MQYLHCTHQLFKTWIFRSNIKENLNCSLANFIETKVHNYRTGATYLLSNWFLLSQQEHQYLTEKQFSKTLGKASHRRYFGAPVIIILDI